MGFTWRGLITDSDDVSPRPKVSVIVPNYNHAPYLRERLESVYGQTYTNFEVILMDDCSSDGSREILEEYARRYPWKTKLLINEKNSGRVFEQWKKGIAEASGSLIWIAESDDYCTSDFLETLVPYFKCEAVMLAYVRSDFVRDGRKVWDIESYLSDLDPKLWHRPFVKTAHELVRKYFCVKNIIPNASSALFRHTGHVECLNSDVMKQFRFCGDWYLYLHLTEGGLVAYTPHAVNYYRQHGHNTSVSLHQQPTFYREHGLIADFLQQAYGLGASELQGLKREMERRYDSCREKVSLPPLSSMFSIDAGKNAARKAAARKLNIGICGAAFISGGGETFPIYLANALRDAGHCVTYINFHYAKSNPDVRVLLRGDIPVVDLSNDHRDLEALCRSFGFEVLHSHFIDVDFAVMKALQRVPNCRHIVTLHGMYESVSPDYFSLRHYELRDLAERVHAFAYLSQKQVDFFADKGYPTSHFVKIANGLPLGCPEAVSREELNVPQDAFLLCLASRALREKGWREAIEAVKRANERSEREIHLLLLGDGSETVALQRESLPPYIHLLGFRGNVRAYFAASDAGILPTYFKGENFPLVMIECLMTGKPFLVSELAETPFILSAGEGQLAGAALPLADGLPDVEAFAACIAEWADKPSSYRAIKSLVPAAARKLDIREVSRQYLACYASSPECREQGDWACPVNAFPAGTGIL